MESLNSQGYHSDLIQGFDNGLRTDFSTNPDTSDTLAFGIDGNYDRNSNELTRFLQSPSNDSGYHTSSPLQYCVPSIQEIHNSGFGVPYTPTDLFQTNQTTMADYNFGYNENLNHQYMLPNNPSTEISGTPTQFSHLDPFEPTAQRSIPGNNNADTYPSFSSPTPGQTFNTRDFPSVDQSVLVDQCRSLQSEINVPNNLGKASKNELLALFKPISRSESSRLREYFFGVHPDAQKITMELRASSQKPHNSNKMRQQFFRGILNLFSEEEFPPIYSQNQCQTPSQFYSHSTPNPSMEAKKTILEKDIPSLVNELKEIVRKNKTEFVINSAFRHPPEHQSRFNSNLGQMHNQSFPSSFSLSHLSPSTSKMSFPLDESRTPISHPFKPSLAASPSVSSPRSSAAKDILIKHNSEDCWDVGGISKKQKVKSETDASPMNGLSQSQSSNNRCGDSQISRNAEELIRNQQVEIQNLKKDNETLKSQLDELKGMMKTFLNSRG